MFKEMPSVNHIVLKQLRQLPEEATLGYLGKLLRKTTGYLSTLFGECENKGKPHLKWSQEALKGELSHM